MNILAFTFLSLALLLGTAFAQPRVINEEELSSMNGAGGEGDVWLSVLGKVYDVTEGRRFYGEGGSYSVFGAKDNTANFATGKFDDPEVDFANLSEKHLSGLRHWTQFYKNNENYKQIGVLGNGIFYDTSGIATELHVSIERLLAKNQADSGADEF